MSLNPLEQAEANERRISDGIDNAQTLLVELQRIIDTQQPPTIDNTLHILHIRETIQVLANIDQRKMNR